jgi:hypothetical protein
MGLRRRYASGVNVAMRRSGRVCTPLSRQPARPVAEPYRATQARVSPPAAWEGASVLEPDPRRTLRGQRVTALEQSSEGEETIINFKVGITLSIIEMG